MANSTKKNHYVPRFYLKSFQKDGIVYQRDLTNNKIYPISNLMEVCKKNNLYTIQDKIKRDDIIFFFQIACRGEINPHDQNFFAFLVSFLNDEFANLLEFECSDGSDFSKINEGFRKIFNNPISRNQEDLYGKYEGDFAVVYNDILTHENLLCLRKEEGYSFKLHHFLKITQYIFKHFHLRGLSKLKDLDPEGALKLKKDFVNIHLLKDCGYYDIIYYLVSQYFRTLKMHESIEAIFDSELVKYTLARSHEILNPHNVRSNNFMYLMSHYQTINLTNNLVALGYKLVLVKNCTDLNFITSDNPSINTYSHVVKSGGDLKEEEFEILFPLSPKLAVLYSKKDNYLDLSTIEIKSIIQISIWNAAIKEGAQRYIYSDSEEIVKIH
jgi:hypothetical protein